MNLEQNGERMTDQELRQSVGESFNIYQATVAMCSIFMGFVFAALLQLIGGDAPLSRGREVTAWFLVAALFLLLYGLIFQHLTANQVVRYWKIFMPMSRARRTGILLFECGIVAMLVSTVSMLWSKGLWALGAFACTATLVFVWLTRLMRGCHAGAAYMRFVDNEDREAPGLDATSPDCTGTAQSAESRSEGIS